jgi:hypothetical protein
MKYHEITASLDLGKVAWRESWPFGAFIKKSGGKLVDQNNSTYSKEKSDRGVSDWQVASSRPTRGNISFQSKPYSGHTSSTHHSPGKHEEPVGGVYSSDINKNLVEHTTGIHKKSK